MATVLNEPEIMKTGGEPAASEDIPAHRKPPSIGRQLLSNPLSVTGFIILSLFAFVALFAPVLAPPLENARDPMKIPRDGFGTVPQPPGTVWQRNPPPLPFWYTPLTGKTQWVHLFGMASGGWDLYYGVIWGTRSAFIAGLVITFFVVLIGVVVGTFSAFYGGKVDLVVQRITEIFMAFPFFIAAMTAATLLQPLIGAKAGVGGAGLLTAAIAIVVFGWMGYSRLIRGDILSVRERDYVMAARAVGARDRNIMLKHIVPNAIFPTLVLASLDIGTYVVTFAALSFLGLGAEVGYADWGQLISFSRNWITTLDQYWYIVFFPSLALVLFVLAWNLVGDAVRDVMDPRSRKTR
ncbi:MAG TPA: ABC transporter permease [Anaerolineae bacterium]|nr:ABC transporter permease [Anaerolineae bacterium]